MFRFTTRKLGTMSVLFVQSINQDALTGLGAASFFGSCFVCWHQPGLSGLAIAKEAGLVGVGDFHHLSQRCQVWF